MEDQEKRLSLLQHDHLSKSLEIKSYSQSPQPNHTNNETTTQCCGSGCSKCSPNWGLLFAALFESLDSTLGIFMAGAVFCETVNIHSLYWSLGIAGFFGILIWIYTYKLLELKHREEKSSNVKKLGLSCLGNTFLLFTSLAAGLDAGAALFQQTVERWNSSLLFAWIFLGLGVLSSVCRAAKYYVSDLGTQVSEPSKLTFIHWFTKDNCCATKILQRAVFQLFAFGEALAHLLAAYILYSDFIKPYLLTAHPFAYATELSMFLLSIGVIIGALAFFAQYVIICAADLDWAAQTLDKKSNGISGQIDNRFGLIGQVLLNCMAFFYKIFCCCQSSEKAFYYLRGQIKWSKILGQGVFVGAGFLLLASIVWTGLSTTLVAGSITSISINNTTIPAWAVAMSIFAIGYVAGLFLGFRQWKAKNANKEVDSFIASFLKHFGWKFTLQPWQKNRSNKNLPSLWMEVKQLYPEEKGFKNIKNNWKAIFTSFFCGSILGAGYAIEKLHLPFGQTLSSGKFYGYTFIAGTSFALFSLLVIAVGRKELLFKESANDDHTNDNIIGNDKGDDTNKHTSLLTITQKSN